MWGVSIMIILGLSCYVDIFVVATWYVWLKMRVNDQSQCLWLGEMLERLGYWLEWIGWYSLDN